MVTKALGATVALVGAAASVTKVLSNPGAAASGLLGNSFSGQLPAPNILSKYASYDYVITLSSLSVEDINYPDATYQRGKKLPIVCKSASAQPENRVKTSYGKHEYFIENLTCESTIGLVDPRTTNVTTIQFDVFEPYSIGMFVHALQKAAYDAQFANWRDAPFLLSIEFRGNTETGQIANVPFAARHIPIKLSTISIKSSEQGTRYSVTGYATNGQALTTEFANLKTDVTLKGTTVQEVLQTGEQSLQNIVNRKLQEHVKNGTVKVADQIVILFPNTEEIPTATSSSVNAGKPENKKTATTTAIIAGNAEATDVFKRIGVQQSTLSQKANEVNIIGQSSMGYDLKKRADSAPKEVKAGVTFDEKSNTYTRANVIVNPAEGTMKFSRDADIPSMITQVLLTSMYPDEALKAANIDKGQRKWFKIDTQVYYLKSVDDLEFTGSYPRVVVYRVVPFLTNAAKFSAVNQEVAIPDSEKKKIVKRYDYIYTGKNSEIIRFNIDFSVNFANVLASDDFKSYIDAERKKKAALSNGEKEGDPKPIGKGSPVPNRAGANATMHKLTGGKTSLDGRGGGTESAMNRAARFFHDAITNPNDMTVLEMEVWGDPYWIAQSGQGNYTSKPVPGVPDLNADGSVNWQNGEVKILVNFRSPLDLNQSTGLYDFKSPNHMDMSTSPKAGPVLGFTGMYVVNRVTNYFRQGKFTQMLKGYRIPLQGEETNKEAKPTNTFNTTNQNTGSKGE